MINIYECMCVYASCCGCGWLIKSCCTITWLDKSLQNTNSPHITALLWAMGCLLWVQSLIWFPYPLSQCHVLGLCSLSSKMSYSQILWNRKATSLDVIKTMSLCNLTRVLAALVLGCLLNFRVIGNPNLAASRLHELLWEDIHLLSE